MKKKKMVARLVVACAASCCLLGFTPAAQAATTSSTAADSVSAATSVTAQTTELSQAAQTTQATATPTLTACAHVSSIGWQDYVGNGKTIGTTGKSLPIEAIRVSLGSTKLNKQISVKVRVANEGWKDAVAGGKTAGTTGKSQAMRAIKISLSGSMAENYDIYYRVHLSNIGWLDWAKNGQLSGTTVSTANIEAVQIKLVKKGAAAPGDTTYHYIASATMTSQARVASEGWLTEQTANKVTLGTTGKSEALRAFKVTLDANQISGSICYKAHVANIGWQSYVKNGALAGTTGTNQVEAVRFKLTGDAAKYYDIYYRVHVENIGWMGWACNGEAAGTKSCGLRAEAVQVKIVVKGTGAPGSTANAFTTQVYKPGQKTMMSKVQSYSSPTGYLLAIDQWNCYVGVFTGSKGNWKLKYYWRCSPGKDSTPTVTGTYQVGIKGYSFGSGYTCYYYTQFYGDYLFHSPLYYEGTRNFMEGTMGTRASHGCVRLEINNAKWIYDNIPSGTTVVSY